METVFYYAWGIIAFFIVRSPLAALVKVGVPFRDIPIPIIYWIWISLGAFILSRFFKKPASFVKQFFLTALFFHLTVLSEGLISMPAFASEIPVLYRMYIYGFICCAVTAMSLWILSGFFIGVKTMTPIGLSFSSMPVIIAVYSFINGHNAAGVLFMCIGLIIGVMIAFRRQMPALKEKLIAFYSVLRDHPRALITCIFILAFIARFAFSVSLIIKTGNEYIFASDDGSTYDSVGLAIAGAPVETLKILVSRIWPPVYMLFVGAVYLILGHNFYVITFIQSVLGAMVPVFVFLTAIRIFGRRPAFVAAILCALNQPLIFISAGLGTEAVYIPLMTGALFLLIREVFFSEKKVVLLFFSGILMGLASMTFGTALYFIPVAVVAMILYQFRQGGKLYVLKNAGLFLAGAFIVWGLVKTFFWIETGDWQALYEKNGIDQWYCPSMFGADIDPDNSEFLKLGIDPKNPGSTVEAIGRNWKDIAVTGAKIFPLRIRDVFIWKKFGSFDTLFLVNAERVPNDFSVHLEFYTIVFFVTGLVLSFTRLKDNRKCAFYFILLFVAYYTFIHGMIFIPQRMRYVALLKPFLVMILSFGIYDVLKYLAYSRD